MNNAPISGLSSLADIIVPQQAAMLKSLKIGVALFLVWAFVIQDSSEEIFWLGLGLCLLSFFPAYLYCKKSSPGLPIFPLFAFTHLWAFGLPLISKEERLAQYPIDFVETATMTVAVYLLIGTLAYFVVSRRSPPPARQMLVVARSSEPVLWVPLVVALGFNISGFYGVGDRFGPLYPVIQAAMLAVQSLAVFVLAFRYGNRTMSRPERSVFLVVLAVMIILQVATLYLVGGMTLFLIATVAFAIGRGRLPWLTVVTVLACFAVLHSGKSKMREKYWAEGAASAGIFQLPGYFREWVSYSLEDGIKGLFKVSARMEGESQSILQRSSLLHLLVFEQVMCPDTIPYMHGETYALIPQLLVPRFMNKDKIWSHAGTYSLNLHFGIQTTEQTESTTIGWGLLNEAFANFGLVGIGSLALILGSVYGWIERMTSVGSLLSMRVFAGILVLTAAFQTEYSAGVFVSSLFQSMCVLLLAALFMQRASVLEKPGRFRTAARPMIPAAASLSQSKP